MRPAHYRQLRGRRAVLAWALTLVTIQAGFAILLEGPLDHIRNPEYAARRDQVVARQRENSDRPLIVALGSSRTMNGLDAASLNGDPAYSQGPLVYNFGMHGITLVDQYLVLRRLLHEGIRPGGVIAEITPFLLAWDMKSREMLPTMIFHRRDLAEFVELDGDGTHKQKAWLASRLAPTFSYRFFILDHYMPSWLKGVACTNSMWRGIDDWGWYRIRIDRTSQECWEFFRDYCQEDLKHLKVTKINYRTIHRLLSLCADESIPVTLLLMPEAPKFRAMYSPQSVERLNEILSEMQNDYGVHIVDARCWVDYDEGFTDGHHLRVGGAKVFTQRFGREVLSLFGDPDHRPLLTRPHRAKEMASMPR